MEEFWCAIIFGFIGIIVGVALEFCIVVSTLNEGEYITFRMNNTTIKSESYYIKNIERINENECKILIKRRNKC